MSRIQYALISVSDKRGVEDFARQLDEMGVTILSTGGTAALLSEKGIHVEEVSKYTGLPELFDGRVKTLHPKIHGGILFKREDPEHLHQAEKHEIQAIDLVVVNLYPFEETVAKKDSTEEAIIENIDIGGPALIRAAAKNFKHVGIVVDPDDYPMIIDQLKQNGGKLPQETRTNLAAKAFNMTAQYDSAISGYFGEKVASGETDLPSILHFSFQKVQELRYGENPHQKAAFYSDRFAGQDGFTQSKQLQGKELSFNNILDLFSAYQLVNEFKDTVSVIIKHNNPCGVALGEDLATAYRNARDVDPDSAFGGIIGLNRTVDAATAKEITSAFVEAVIAPGYSDEALEIFSAKKNVRLMVAPKPSKEMNGRLDIKRVEGGLLVQEADELLLDESNFKVVTKRQPTEDELLALRFAWTISKHVKSNAIVYALKDQAVGIGAGQMSRVDSAKIAGLKARKPVQGCVMASDGFFPFRDSIDAAAEAGITAVIQPGGSIKDDEVIAAADEHNMAMVLTGVRHFKH